MHDVGELTITTELAPRGPAAAFVLTEEQVEAIGEGAKRFPARVLAGGAELRGTVTRMRGEFLFGLSKAVRQQAGLEIGDTVTITIALDDGPREVEVPEDLAGALAADPAVRTAFDGPRLHPSQGVSRAGSRRPSGPRRASAASLRRWRWSARAAPRS